MKAVTEPYPTSRCLREWKDEQIDFGSWNDLQMDPVCAAFDHSFALRGPLLYRVRGILVF